MQVHRKLVLEDLDSLRSALPFAAAELTLWARPFKTELYTTLEKHLRALHGQTAIIAWTVAIPDGMAEWKSALQDLLAVFVKQTCCGLQAVAEIAETLARQSMSETDRGVAQI